MTDRRILLHAKEYIDKMANGINPLTDQPIADEDLLNNVRISRCLFYVSGVLEDVLTEKERPAAPAPTPAPIPGYQKKAPFSITAEELEAFAYSEVPLSITEIVRRINAIKHDYRMRQLNFHMITGYLSDNGYLESAAADNGRFTKRPTAKGEAIGIKVIERTKDDNTFRYTVYDVQAQHFIIDNLAQILKSAETARGDETPRDSGDGD